MKSTLATNRLDSKNKSKKNIISSLYGAKPLKNVNTFVNSNNVSGISHHSYGHGHQISEKPKHQYNQHNLINKSKSVGKNNFFSPKTIDYQDYQNGKH